MTLSQETFARLADVAVRVGVNVQPGQKLMVMAPLEAADLVRAVAVKAYEAGAHDVLVHWSDEKTRRIRLLMAPDAALADYPLWLARGFEELADAGAAFLSVASANPELLAGVAPARVAAATLAEQKAVERFKSHLMGGRVAWSIVSAPTPGWARKVFPGLAEDEAVVRLWGAIAKASRVDVEDPVAHWREHARRLADRAQALNRARIRRLRYRAPGTDLSVDLPAGHRWMGGAGPNAAGTAFMPNIPTEEVFTLPARDGVNGTVRSTMPLAYGGVTIDNIALTFREGRIVDFTSDTARETLATLIETDEGSHRLGEVALVPVDSPISSLGILFYNTLFDENASCHLAIGRAYPFTLEGGEAIETDEELVKRGGNVSLTHVDFMIGSAAMDVDADTADGRSLPILRGGRWAAPF